MNVFFFRVLLIFSPGYIHPDEFFQSYEVMAGDVLSGNVIKPWEFSDSPLSRSYLPLFLTHGWIFWVISLLGLENYGGILLLGPRFFFVILLFVCDGLISGICKNLSLTKEQESEALWLFQTSWVSLLLFSRTFSNTLESFIVCLVLYLVTLQVVPSQRLGLIGGLCSFALFVRITSPAFLGPSIIYLFFTRYQYFKRLSYSRKDLFYEVMMSITNLSFGGLCVLFVGIILDSKMQQHNNGFQITFTPLNNILYNMNSKNLALHGLHPRYINQ